MADRVDKVLIDSVGVSPLAAAGGGGGGGLSSVVAVVVAVVVPPVVGAEMSVAKDCHRSRDLTCTRGWAGSGVGAPWFLTGWVEGTEVEFMIDWVPGDYLGDVGV